MLEVYSRDYVLLVDEAVEADDSQGLRDFALLQKFS